MVRKTREAGAAEAIGTPGATPNWLHSQPPLERSTVPDQIASRVIDLVKAGNLRAGDKLPSENELAATFGVSRPSVREGLKTLRVLGVVEASQGGRHYVTDLSTQRLIEPIRYVVMLQDYDVTAHLEARMTVDLALIRLTCERATQAEIEKVRLLAKAGHQFMRDPVGFRVLDVEFHQAINSAARSPMLARVSQALYELGFDYRRIATETPGVIEKSVTDHDLIARAITARRPDLAEKAFRRHLENVRVTTVQAKEMAAHRDRRGALASPVVQPSGSARKSIKRRNSAVR